MSFTLSTDQIAFVDALIDGSQAPMRKRSIVINLIKISPVFAAYRSDSVSRLQKPLAEVGVRSSSRSPVRPTS